jgi:hypothetical protein
VVRLVRRPRDLGAVLDHEEPLPHPASDQDHLLDRNQVVSRDEWPPKSRCSKMRTAFSEARCTEPGTARAALGYSAREYVHFSPWRNKSSAQFA